MFQLIVNLLGTLVAGLCAILLLRAYGRVRKRLLLWAGLCFGGLCASNAWSSGTTRRRYRFHPNPRSAGHPPSTFSATQMI